MKEKYLINIVSQQNIEGESDSYEITTEALLELNDTGYVISYSEEDEQGNPVTTNITLKGGSLSVLRISDGITSELVLEKRIRHVSHHRTPYGSFSMGINAVEILSDITENGGRLYFKYTTDIELSHLGEISFDITLKNLKG